jgi:hypothetical protein
VSRIVLAVSALIANSLRSKISSPSTYDVPSKSCKHRSVVLRNFSTNACSAGVLREARVESLHRAAKPHDGFLRVSVGHEQKHLLRCCDSRVPPRPHARVDDAHSLLVASSHLLVSLGVVPVDVPGELVQDHD